MKQDTIQVLKVKQAAKQKSMSDYWVREKKIAKIMMATSAVGFIGYAVFALVMFASVPYISTENTSLIAGMYGIVAGLFGVSISFLGIFISSLSSKRSVEREEANYYWTKTRSQTLYSISHRTCDIEDKIDKISKKLNVR